VKHKLAAWITAAALALVLAGSAVLPAFADRDGLRDRVRNASERSSSSTATTKPGARRGWGIHHHGGIQGGEDLIPAVHDWNNARPVVRIVIERIA
jgi:hypothetical protein